jgi:multidrug resistance efflux pump
VRVLEAQIAQADAQLALIDEQLVRTKLRAPFDGVVGQGRPEPVALARRSSAATCCSSSRRSIRIRVILKVDERDITNVKVGQSGLLTLSSMPHDAMPMAVEKITPVSVVEEGRNLFRVEAAVKGGIEKLRPGMEGVGKIEVD